MIVAETQQISLLDSLSGKGSWLQLPFAVMRDVGPAVQTLAGLLLISRRDTFSPVSDIAERAGLPLKTCRNHFAELESGGWVVNKGRCQNAAGMTVRTCTICVTKKTIDSLCAGSGPSSGPTYGILPWWATNEFQRPNGSWKCLPWGSRALLSLILARMAVMKNTIEPGIGMAAIEADRFYEEWANMEDDRHCRLPLPEIEKITGLSQRAAGDAKKNLHELGFIEPTKSSKGDLLKPNPNFLCMVNPETPSRCVVLPPRSDSPLANSGIGSWQIWALPLANLGIGP